MSFILASLIPVYEVGILLWITLLKDTTKKQKFHHRYITIYVFKNITEIILYIYEPFV